MAAGTKNRLQDSIETRAPLSINLLPNMKRRLISVRIERAEHLSKVD